MPQVCSIASKPNSVNGSGMRNSLMPTMSAISSEAMKIIASQR